MNPAVLSQAGIFFVILLCSLALHEFAHAWVADKRGDPLPRAQGRVTLDPLAHLDPLGSFLIPGAMILLPILTGGSLPMALIGWGKPVQVSLPNSKTRRLDDILITLAGPGMNLLIALVSSIVAGVALGLSSSSTEALERIFLPVILINIMLAVFNLIPVPPLDGSRVLFHMIHMKEETYARLASFGWIILLILINIPPVRMLFGYALVFARLPFLLLIHFIAGLLQHQS
ncbi:MAG: site-2 protease family protein [Puniceicoccales bacterium]|jgi:Zn-dependent protease|nr:site-2 protease family protein [Puniceicoccales bacterium]